MITLELERDEAEAIVKVLGNLPTSSNAYPLLVKLVQQINQQNPEAEEAED